MPGPRTCGALQTRLLLTAAGPSMQRVMHDLALPTFRRYARRWGWTVRAVDLPSDGSGADGAAQAAKWAKVPLLRKALEDYDVVLWLDADVLIKRVDEDITTHLHPDDFQALALEHVPAEHRINPNTGVWLLRGPRAIEFLNAVETAGPQPGPWADQGGVLRALGWHRGDDRYHWARPGPGSEWLARTSWLPPSWNQPYVGARAESDVFNSRASSYASRPTVVDPHALHFMGLTPEARYRHMSASAAPAYQPGVAAAVGGSRMWASSDRLD